MPHASDTGSGARLVEAACRLIDERIEDKPDLAFLARRLNVSESRLQRVFKRHTGLTLRQYAEARRAEVFKAGVRTGSTVTEAMYEAGYSSASRLYEGADSRFGMTPATYKRGGRGMSVEYTIAESPLGWLLVGATARGICSVMLGDDPEALAAALRDEFPEAASIRRDDAHLRAHVEALLESLAGDAAHDELPLDVAGTAFQMRVWEELRRIPRGETISYGELARRIGRPTASRAVARACATNPVAVVTPCHRVVRGNGELGGYRWGIERKRRLLEAERENAHT